MCKLAFLSTKIVFKTLEKSKSGPVEKMRI